MQLVEEFYKKHKELNKQLYNYIFVIIKRMLSAANAYPEQLVSSLRIIEREEVYTYLPTLFVKIKACLWPSSNRF